MEVPTLADVVAARGRRLELEPGRVLFRQGDPSQSVYACLAGRIDLTLTTPSGRELMVATVGPRQVFGELAALDGTPRSATATAAGPGAVARLSGDEFLAAVASEPHVALAMMRAMASHMRRTTERIAARTSESTTERVAHLLIELAARFGRYGATRTPVELTITHDELARWIGTTREAASRSLGELRRTGTVTTGRGRIIVTDVDALTAFVRSIAR